MIADGRGAKNWLFRKARITDGVLSCDPAGPMSTRRRGWEETGGRRGLLIKITGGRWTRREAR